MATIRQRGKYWEAQVRRTGYPTCSRTFDLKSDARAWASIIESEMERGVFIDRTEAEKNTFGDLIERYMREVSIHKKGMQSECYRLKSLLRDPISKVKISALSSRMMAEWRDRRLKKVSSGTTNRDLSLISHVINVARKEWGIHTDNPIAMIRRPPESRGRNRRLVADEEQRLYAALTIPPRDEKGRHTGPSNPWMLPLVVVAIETAMRRSEILSLTWGNVHLVDRFVRLHDTKNGEPRDVPLTIRAVSTLDSLPRHISGRVFPISGDAVKKSFTRAVGRAGLQNFHFHDLRHEGTSRLAQKLDNVLELSAVTGHKSLSMLKRYYHPLAKDLARKLD